MSQVNSHRAGWTIVELLVSLAVIALLLAIAVPAVQQVRERARQTECQNHLRQIGVALHNHHSQFGQLPEDGLNGYGFGVFLLPHLEQSALYQRLKPLTTRRVTGAPARPDVEGVILSVFRCPSDTGSDRLKPSGYARSNYLGTHELFSERTALTNVLDGASNTIAVGETITDHAWVLSGTGQCDKVPNGGGRFSSRHAGGAYFVMCDGSVKFISETIDADTFRALCTPAGSEVIGEF